MPGGPGGDSRAAGSAAPAGGPGRGTTGEAGRGPLRILVATSWNRSAVSWQTRAVCRELQDRGHEVHFLDDRRNVPPGTEGIRHIHAWPGTGRPTGPGAVRYAVHLLRELRPHVLVANFVSVNSLGPAGALVRVPTRICWYHSMGSAIDTDRGASGAAARARRRLTLLRKAAAYRTYTHFVAVSEAAAEDLQRRFLVRRPVAVQHNSVVDGPRREGTAGIDGPIVCVGRLDRSKGQDVLLRAAAAAGISRPLLLAGAGPELDALRGLAGDLGVQAEFLGETANARVRELMASASVVAVPTRAEAFGLTAAEALAAGVPVVGSAVGGVREVLADPASGVLVPPDDPPALGAALARVLDHDTNEAMGVAARRRFEEHFESARRAREVADWIESAARGRSS